MVNTIEAIGPPVLPAIHELSVLPGEERVDGRLTTAMARLLPFDWHDEFDKKRGKASFHNRNHVEGFEQAALACAEKSKESDPLRLREDLQRWKKKPDDQRVNFEEFKEALRWTARFHDTGNIMDRVEFVGGIPVPVYIQDEEGNFCYRAQDAEVRSIEIFETVIRQTDMDPQKMERLVPLVKDMIDQTRLAMTSKDKKLPFARAMRFIDQIAASLYYSDRKAMIMGLILETVTEFCDRTLRPRSYFNFVCDCASQLIGEDALAETLLVLGKELPKKDEDLPDEEMPMKDFLDKYGSPYLVS